MPADPNARRDQKLEGILGALKETNKLLSAQNKILEKMERSGRVQAFQQHPYLERTEGTDGGTGPGATPSEGSVSSPGTIQGGDTDSAR